MADSKAPHTKRDVQALSTASHKGGAWKPVRINYKIFGKILSNLLANADVHHVN
jgi:hypothetical protein